MDLSTLPTVSDKIVLADIHPDYAKLEAAHVQSPDERVWVIVSQATEQDARNRAALTARREASYTFGEDGKMKHAGEAVTENVYERIMLETYCTLQDVGNLMRNGKPVFPTMPAKLGKRADFEKAWGSLPPVLAEAIHKAVRSMNPDWDWELGKA